MSFLPRVITLSVVACLPVCIPVAKAIEFDVPYGMYETYLKQNVGAQGALTCKVTTQGENRGEKWVPSVILAAAQDDAEDDTLFLSSYVKLESQERLFVLRTFNKAQPIINTVFSTVNNQAGLFSLRLSWAADGAIGYQVANGDKGEWSALQQVAKPGFSVRHVSVHVSGMKGRADCRVQE